MPVHSPRGEEGGKQPAAQAWSGRLSGRQRYWQSEMTGSVGSFQNGHPIHSTTGQNPWQFLTHCSVSPHANQPIIGMIQALHSRIPEENGGHFWPVHVENSLLPIKLFPHHPFKSTRKTHRYWIYFTSIPSSRKNRPKIEHGTASGCGTTLTDRYLPPTHWSQPT